MDDMRCSVCRQVAALIRQMDLASVRLAAATRPHRARVAAEVAAARQQLAALQKNLGRQFDLFSTRLAPQLCNSLSISSTGQVRTDVPPQQSKLGEVGDGAI